MPAVSGGTTLIEGPHTRHAALRACGFISKIPYNFFTTFFDFRRFLLDTFCERELICFWLCVRQLLLRSHI